MKKTKSFNGIFAQALQLMEVCNRKKQYNRTDAIRKIAFKYFDNIRAAVIVNRNSDAWTTAEFPRKVYAGY